MPKPLLTNNSWFKNVFGDLEFISWDSYIHSKWFNYLEIELIMTPNLQREAVYTQRHAHSALSVFNFMYVQ